MTTPIHLEIIDPEGHHALLCEAEKKMKVERGQKKYAFEYMKTHAGRFVMQGDLLAYCDRRRAEDTQGKRKNFKDNSRAIETMRKDKLPLEWAEIYVDGQLWFKYDPTVKERCTQEVVDRHAHKMDTFSNQTIITRIMAAKHRCEITGIPLVKSGDANADHFIPREKGGLSTEENCVILGSHLNTSKNNSMPIPWFCKTLLSNFLRICQRVGCLDEAKEQIDKFVRDF
jgi:5-methylcytosine-specific restriction endonuclease McrA